MKLREARCQFTHHLAFLIIHATDLGFECAGNELLRDPRIAALNAQSGKGVKRSTHLHGLAIDLNLYKDGVYQDKTEQHRELGEWWEKRHPLARWGGRFNDGNHYSFEWEGVK